MPFWRAKKDNSYEESMVKDIIFEKFPKLKSIYTHTLVAPKVAARRNPNNSAVRSILIRKMKAIDIDRLLKESRTKKEITYKGVSLRFAAVLLKGTLQAQKQ